MDTLQCSAHTFPRPIDRVDTFSIAGLNLNLGHNAPVTHFTLRAKSHARLVLRHRLHPVHASNGSSEASDETKSSEAAKGPPFLTILAGFLIFFAICWIAGSIVMWLVGLIFRVPPSK